MKRSQLAPDSRAWWKDKARVRLRNITYLHARIDQIQADHDAIEDELRALLSTDPTDEPNPTLTAMSHGDLVLLADQWRRRAIGCER